ncbi:MAG TPA: queuosine salvage family protein [Acidimicrobiia bacterium]|nr:queuosine salvage family protein [Acidimicrobiia bacterium]
MTLIRTSPPPSEWGVVIDRTASGGLAERWRERDFPPPAFDYPGLPSWKDEDWFDFCVLGCSVVACLWPPTGEPVWATEFEGVWLDDAPGLFACFARQPLQVEDFLDFGPLQAREFFAGRGSLQMINERATTMQGVARALFDRWGGQALKMNERAQWDGPRLVQLLVETIPGYRDEAETSLGKLSFNKLAHLCVAMMNSRSSRPIGRLETFPVYPDYMLPKVLRYYGVLRYESELSSTVDGGRLVPAGSDWEVAIRWATVYAGDQLRADLNRIGNPVSTPALDYALWHDAVLGSEAALMGPHHRTVTMAY